MGPGVMKVLLIFYAPTLGPRVVNCTVQQTGYIIHNTRLSKKSLQFTAHPPKMSIASFTTCLTTFRYIET